jgi:hypothetical protein
MTCVLYRLGHQLAGTLLVALLVGFRCAGAYADVSITENELRTPWEQHLLVLQSLAGSIRATPQARQREALADSLARLQVSLGEYETQVDTVIDRIIGDPQYAFVAAETSEALSLQIADVHGRFDALYALLGVADRADVRAAQATLDALRKALAGRVAFEADVIRIRASAARQEIVGLATRWWNGEERAIAVKKLVADLRQTLEALPRSEEPR